MVLSMVILGGLGNIYGVIFGGILIGGSTASWPRNSTIPCIGSASEPD